MTRCSRRAAGLEVGSLIALHYKGDTRVSFQAVQKVVDGAVKVERRKMVPFDGNAHMLFQDVPDIRKRAIDLVVEYIEEETA